MRGVGDRQRRRCAGSTRLPTGGPRKSRRGARAAWWRDGVGPSFTMLTRCGAESSAWRGRPCGDGEATSRRPRRLHRSENARGFQVEGGEEVRAGGPRREGGQGLSLITCQSVSRRPPARCPACRRADRRSGEEEGAGALFHRRRSPRSSSEQWPRNARRSKTPRAQALRGEATGDGGAARGARRRRDAGRYSRPGSRAPS